MQSTLFTNSNVAFEILNECVNVQHLDGVNKSQVEDIFIYDHLLLPNGHGDEIRFTIQELRSLRPDWDPLVLDRLQETDGVHDCYLYDGRHYYNAFYDKATREVLFDKTYFWPEHFRPNDLIFEGKRICYDSTGEIRRFLKIPRMTRDLERDLYFRVDLGCPLSHYELQQSLREAFKKLLEEDSMET